MTDFISPPADTPALKAGNWFAVPGQDPVVEHLTRSYWKGPSPAKNWQVARRSQAVYVYRETASGWSMVAKFYAAKTGAQAGQYAQRELNCIQRARQAGLSDGSFRAVRPGTVWRGVLFLEHVSGLTLEDAIAVRRSRPGRLFPALEQIARLLATLHSPQAPSSGLDDFPAMVLYARKVADNLARHGVLQEDPLVQEGLSRLLDRWAADPEMSAFQPAFTHGDATTTNFILPQNGTSQDAQQEPEVVVIDWERAKVTDPAADIGRLQAEIIHSVTRYGGDVEEAMAMTDCVNQAYRDSLPADRQAASLISRARFYQAVSALRIARNGWLSRLDRTALVARSMALLS